MNLTQPEYISRLLRLFHPEKKYAFLFGANDESILAGLHGLSLDLYKQNRVVFDNNANQAAQELLDELEFNQSIERISIRRGGRVVVIGDSLTDDYQSWFEIVRHAFTMVRPNDGINFFNTAISGDTSAQLLGMVVKAVDLQPDLLLCLIGTNDAREQGPGGVSCTSLSEVKRNLDAIATYARQHSTASWLWVTPSGVNEHRIAGDVLLNQFKAFWPNHSIDAIAELVLERAEPAVDLREHFQRTECDPFAEDGLHWSLAGHKIAAKAIVNRLVDLDSREGRL